MNENKVTVYTYGVFDLFHSGHVELLSEARALGDKLVVGIFSDEVAKNFKRDPVISLEHRMSVVRACKFVDDVIIQTNLSPDDNLLLIKPDILAKGPGAGWGENTLIPGENVIVQLGGRVVKLNYHEGISTSQIIEKIKNL